MTEREHGALLDREWCRSQWNKAARHRKGAVAALGMDVENVNRQCTFGLRKLIERKEKIPREFMELFMSD